MFLIAFCTSSPTSDSDICRDWEIDVKVPGKKTKPASVNQEQVEAMKVLLPASFALTHMSSYVPAIPIRINQRRGEYRQARIPQSLYNCAESYLYLFLISEPSSVYVFEYIQVKIHFSSKSLVKMQF